MGVTHQKECAHSVRLSETLPHTITEPPLACSLLLTCGIRGFMGGGLHTHGAVHLPETVGVQARLLTLSCVHQGNTGLASTPKTHIMEESLRRAKRVLPADVDHVHPVLTATLLSYVGYFAGITVQTVHP